MKITKKHLTVFKGIKDMDITTCFYIVLGIGVGYFVFNFLPKAIRDIRDGVTKDL